MKRTIVTASVFIAFSCLGATAPLVRAQTPNAQGDDAPYEERTIEVDGLSLRYLDFGGDGLNVVFTPALLRSAEGYADLGALLQDNYRVLAVGRRDADSTISKLGVQTHAEDLLGFLDALGIEQAVLAGNTEPAYRMTYIVEQHPERVAGVIYLAGPPSAAGHLFENPASGWPMLVRSWGRRRATNR